MKSFNQYLKDSVDDPERVWSSKYKKTKGKKEKKEVDDMKSAFFKKFPAPKK